MGDSRNNSYAIGNSSAVSKTIIDKKTKGSLSASRNLPFAYRSSSKTASPKRGTLGMVAAVQPLASFLLKVAALELVRRFSKAKCPFLWSGLQALQVVCYPPLKFIQRWRPFAALVKGMQILSRPLLVLSVATAFSDHSRSRDAYLDDVQDSHSNSRTVKTQHMSQCDEGSESPSRCWLLKLYEELDKEGIVLPERIDEEELKRFYDTAHGDIPSFIGLVKKTISWRENYRILSVQELERWTDLVFWHGFEIKQQPCLIVRLGLACMTVPFHERPLFSQAIVSQVEYGVLHILDDKYPRITVFVDCEGLPPLKLPMQIMRSCSSILQEHFPKRLGYIFVIRLPPVAQVIARAFIQFLKPGTSAKLKVLGRMYQKELMEYVEILPSYLDGQCMCIKCTNEYRISSDSFLGETSSDGTLVDYNTNEFPESQDHPSDYQIDNTTDDEFPIMPLDHPSEFPESQDHPNDYQIDYTTDDDYTTNEFPESQDHPSDYQIDYTTDDEFPIMPLDRCYEMNMNTRADYIQGLRTAVLGLLMIWVMIVLIAGLGDSESRPSLPLRSE